MANLTELGVVDPVVKATVTLSESGFVSVSDAIAYGEVKDDTLTGKLKGLFAASPAEDTTTETVTNQPPRESDSAPDSAHTTSSSSAGAESSSSSSSSPSSSSEATPSPLAEVKRNIQKEQTISLTVNTHFSSIRPMTLEEKKESRSR